MSVTLTDDLINMLKKYAIEEASSDDPDSLLCDRVGSNIDDAYSVGNEDGYIQLARDILTALNINYK